VTEELKRHGPGASCRLFCMEQYLFMMLKLDNDRSAICPHQSMAATGSVICITYMLDTIICSLLILQTLFGILYLFIYKTVQLKWNIMNKDLRLHDFKYFNVGYMRFRV